MKKNDGNKLAELVDEVISDVDSDRDKLLKFLDNLLETHHEQPAGIAEYVARLLAELTRQNQTKIATIKAIGKASISSDDDDDDLSIEIGRPFPEEVDEGSN